jgi:DNA-binding NarL/FixJ family response regulator
MTVRVLVADDDALNRAGLTTLLAADPDIEVVAAVGGPQAVVAAAAARPDAAVFGLAPPLPAGEAAPRQSPAAGVAVLVLIGGEGADLDRDVRAALRAGAAGFVVRGGSPGDLSAAIRAVSAGLGWLAPPDAPTPVEEYAARPVARPPRALTALTAREREVLGLLARGRSNGEIAAELVISTGTVKTHVSRLLTKLGLRDRAQAVVIAYESGLVQPAGGRSEPVPGSAPSDTVNEGRPGAR